jgi:transposase
MANERLGMTKIRQIIRLRQEGASYRSISEMLGISRDAATKYSSLFESSGLNYSEVESLTDSELLKLFNNGSTVDKSAIDDLLSTFPETEKELNHKGMTLLRQWSKYKTNNPDGYNYSRYCFYFKQWQNNNKASMHFEHKSGDKMFIDFTGSKLVLTDKTTGEQREVEVFVAVLGASQLTYVEAVESQKKEDFIAVVENALHYFGGVPAAIVPDNLKSAVTQSSNYEPLLNVTFENFALHYGTAILPARSRKPKDKSLVEGAVKIVYNRIFAEIINRTFFSLWELNTAILQLLTKYNNIKFTGKQWSRRQLFEEIERSELKPLPANRYEIKNYAQVAVYKNSHIYLGADKHYYSVPYKYINKRVEIIYTKTTIEIYFRLERIGCHLRDRKPYGYTTEKEHMPSAHRFVSDWHPDKFIKWAGDIGKSTEEFIRKVLETKQHPEQGYKSCLGILAFGKKFTNERLDNACNRAIYYNSFSYIAIKNILERELDKIAIDTADQYRLPLHNNIRGSQYYK